MVKEYIKKSNIIKARESIEKAIALYNEDDFGSDDLNRIENLMIYAVDLLTPICEKGLVLEHVFGDTSYGKCDTCNKNREDD